MITSELSAVLSKLTSFLSSKGDLQEFSVINSTGELLQAYDGYNGIQIEFNLSDIKGLIPGDTFSKLISSIKTKEIILEEPETGVINIKTKSLRGTIKCIDDLEYPELDFAHSDKQELPPNYKEALEVCRFAVSNDISLGCRTGIIFYGSYAFALDRYNLMMVNLGLKSKNIYVLTTDFATKLLQHKLESFSLKQSADDSDTIDDRIIYSAASDTTLFGSLLKYDLNVSPIKTVQKFRTDDNFTIGTFPTGLKETLSRHEIILDDLQDLEKRVRLELSGKSVTIRSLSNRGKIIEKLKLNQDIGTQKISFQINPLLLTDILKYNPVVTIYRNPLMLEFAEKNFNYFVMGESDE